MTELVQKNEPWMRPVSFSALLGILHLIAEYPSGVRAGKLDAEIKERDIVPTKEGSSPARTTLYHHRNTLVHLGVIRRSERLLFANLDNPRVKELLSNSNPEGSCLDTVSRNIFTELVLGNTDCKDRFFDLFMPPVLREQYGTQQFRAFACPVTWRRVRDNGSNEVMMSSSANTDTLKLRSPSEIKGILYGLRYWARDELKLVDEFFREDRGSVMYPVRPPENNPSPHDVVDEIFALIKTGEEWTILSVQELIVELCEKRKRTLDSLFAALKVLESEYSRQVMLVSTSRSFATLTAASVAREEFELRGYFKDKTGRYISHLRIHNSVRRQSDVPIH